MGLEAFVGSIIQPTWSRENEEIRRQDLALVKGYCKENLGVDYHEQETPPNPSFSLGSYSSIHQLRGFVARAEGHKPLERLAPESAGSSQAMEVEEADLYNFVVPVYKGAHTQFPHLILHSDCDGFYLPFDFENPDNPAEDGEFGGLVSIGSSQRLKAELEYVAHNFLGIPQGDETCEMAEFFSSQWPSVSERNHIRGLWGRMYLLANASVEKGLPIKFC